MITKVLVAIADGVEEIEFVAPVDIMRRAGLDVLIASVGDNLNVVGANGIKLCADVLLKDLDKGFSAIVCPGGLGCSKALAESNLFKEHLHHTKNSGGIIAAICASPALVLEPHGLLDDVEHAVCYPSMKNQLSKPHPDQPHVAVAANIITSQGPGTAIEFGLHLVATLCGETTAKQVSEGIIASHHYKS
ncbi:DJ-1 family protein [Cryptosporidium andersoni]|uniref:DJ-1 family protein n=1 Tax=Cryptosporidium andersoni TaxID=117008 RepID=A0A1J4MVR9_9CRYT|nr:DJ-1 family protein [Cryptosporidium andersoni]